MADAIRPEDVPQPLLDVAQASQFLPGEGAVESDVYLRRQLAAVLTLAREQFAAQVEAIAANYPEDVFPPDSESRDAIGGTAMRHAYRNAARWIREDWPGDDTE